jgi:PHD/YefM family antitoxin component YafN of YafNO toxin-antitoxin module
MISKIQGFKDSIVITEAGRPVAALIDAKTFERIRRMHERFDTLSARVAEAYAHVPEKDGATEIKQAAAQVRAQLKVTRAGAKPSRKRENT